MERGFGAPCHKDANKGKTPFFKKEIFTREENLFPDLADLRRFALSP